MAVAYGAAGTAFSASTNGPAIAYPASVAAGNTLIAVINTRTASTTVTPPTGWLLIASNATSASTTFVLSLAQAAGTESGTLTFGLGATAVTVARMFRISGAAGLVTDFASTSGASSSSVVAPAVTGRNGGLLMCVFAPSRGETSGTGFTQPTGLTEVNDSTSGTTTTDISLGVDYKLLSADGSTGTFTSTSTNASTYVAISLAFDPTPAAAGTNLRPLGDFESGSVPTSFSTTPVYDGTHVLHGTQAIKQTLAGATAFISTGSDTAYQAAVSAATAYAGSLYIWADGAMNARLTIEWLNSSHGFISNSQVSYVACTIGGWTRLVCAATSPAGAAFADFVTDIASSAAGRSYWIDQNQIETGSVATTWAPGPGDIATGASLAPVVTVTATGATGVSTDAAVAPTVAVTCAGSVAGGAFTGTATASAAATIAAGGIVGKSTGGTVSPVVAVAAAGTRVLATSSTSTPAVSVVVAGAVGLSTGAAASSIVATTASGSTGLATGAAVSPAVSVTTAGVVGASTGATVAIAAAATATGSVVRSTGSTATVTTTVTAAGSAGVSGTAVVSPAVTITTAGVTGLSTGSVEAVTVGLTSTGTRVLATGAAVTPAVTITAAGTVTAGLSTTANRPVVATVTTSGQVATQTTAAITVSVTITAGGTVGTQSAATVTATVTTTADGAVGRTTSASQTVTVTATAAGAVGVASAAVLAVAAAITAAGGSHVVSEGLMSSATRPTATLTRGVRTTATMTRG